LQVPKRYQRAVALKKIETNRWHSIKAETSGQVVKGFLDDELLIEYTAERPLKGYVGLWTKADSVTHFEGLMIAENGNSKQIEFL
jgi:pyruvate,water dikinase